MAMRRQEGCTSFFSPPRFRYDDAKKQTEEMYRLVDPERWLLVAVPRDHVDLCHLKDPRGWKEHDSSCEGMLAGGIWKGRVESQLSFFCSLSFSPKVLLST